MTIGEFRDIISAEVPFTMRLDFDNVGLLVGETSRELHRILIALDVTLDVIAEAAASGAELILTHHPVIFSGQKSITDETPTGQLILSLARNGIAALCLHTNLDAISGGVSDALAKALGLESVTVLEHMGVDSQGRDYGAGRIGELGGAANTMAVFLRNAIEALGAKGARYYDAGKPVHRVAVCGGSGGEYLELAHAENCDTYLTADIKYDRFLTAEQLGINLIDAGHFCTENVIVPVLADMVARLAPALDVRVSQHRAVYDVISG